MVSGSFYSSGWRVPGFGQRSRGSPLSQYHSVDKTWGRHSHLDVASLPEDFGLLDVRDGYRAFLAGLASPLDARLAAVWSSGSTGQRPSCRPNAARWRLTNFLRHANDPLDPDPLLDPVRKAIGTVEAPSKQILQRWTSSHSNARLEGLKWACSRRPGRPALAATDPSPLTPPSST